MQLVDAERAAEVRQDLAAMLGHLELSRVVTEHVVDKPRGQFEEILARERLQGLLDAHAVLDEAPEDQVADLVVVQRPGEHLLGSVPEGLATAASGLILAAGDLEERHGLVRDSANPARGDSPLSRTVFAARGARRLLGRAVNRYNDGCGCSGTHACVLGERGCVSKPRSQGRKPYPSRPNGITPAQCQVVFGEESR